ncbi:MAG: FAD-dependent oxidoreductase [Thermaerobacter sp.]|nr:FAD-dependent oxidoreductase [Thermaerobacter sp.]
MRIAIAGGGPAGMAAAVWVRRLGHEPVLYEREARLGGQLHSITLPIPDLPGFASISAQTLLARLQDQLTALQVPVRLEHPIVAFDARAKEIADAAGRTFPADVLIYGPGLKTRKLGIAGEETFQERSVSDLLLVKPAQPVLVVGGGDRAAEAVVRLRQAGVAVDLVHRRHVFRARPGYYRQVLESGARLHLDSEVQEISPAPEGYQVRIRKVDGSSWLWTGDSVLVRIGMEPDGVAGLTGPGGGWDVLPERLPTGAWGVGDAVTPVPFRSLVEAYASAMRVVKRLTSDLERTGWRRD